MTPALRIVSTVPAYHTVDRVTVPSQKGGFGQSASRPRDCHMASVAEPCRNSAASLINLKCMYRLDRVLHVAANYRAWLAATALLTTCQGAINTAQFLRQKIEAPP